MKPANLNYLLQLICASLFLLFSWGMNEILSAQQEPVNPNGNVHVPPLKPHHHKPKIPYPGPGNLSPDIHEQMPAVMSLPDDNTIAAHDRPRIKKGRRVMPQAMQGPSRTNQKYWPWERIKVAKGDKPHGIRHAGFEGCRRNPGALAPLKSKGK